MPCCRTQAPAAHDGIDCPLLSLADLDAQMAADSQMMAWIGKDTIFDPLRSEPRFAALLKKMDANR